MSSLTHKIQELRTALKHNVSAEQSRAITENCQEILNRIEPSCTQLLLGLQVQEVLRNGSKDPTVGCPPSANLKQTAALAEKALGAFRKAWINQGDRARHSKTLDTAADTIATLAKHLLEEVQSFWASEVTGLRQQFHIDAPVLQAQKTVPGADKIYQQYEATLAKFDLEVTHLPVQARNLETLQKLAESLTEIKSQMIFDLPKEVERFFRLLDVQPLGLPLGQVPRSVLDWLEEKHLLNSYRIKRYQA